MTYKEFGFLGLLTGVLLLAWSQEGLALFTFFFGMVVGAYTVYKK